MKNLLIIAFFLGISYVFIHVTAEKAPNLSPEGTVSNWIKSFEEKDVKLFKQLCDEAYLIDQFPSGDKDIHEFFEMIAEVKLSNVHLMNQNDDKATVGFTSNIKTNEESSKIDLEIKLQKRESFWFINGFQEN